MNGATKIQTKRFHRLTTSKLARRKRIVISQKCSIRALAERPGWNVKLWKLQKEGMDKHR